MPRKETELRIAISLWVKKKEVEEEILEETYESPEALCRTWNIPRQALDQTEDKLTVKYPLPPEILGHRRSSPETIILAERTIKGWKLIPLRELGKRVGNEEEKRAALSKFIIRKFIAEAEERNNRELTLLGIDDLEENLQQDPQLKKDFLLHCALLVNTEGKTSEEIEEMGAQKAATLEEEFATYKIFKRKHPEKENFLRQRSFLRSKPMSITEEQSLLQSFYEKYLSDPLTFKKTNAPNRDLLNQGLQLANIKVEEFEKENLEEVLSEIEKLQLGAAVRAIMDYLTRKKLANDLLKRLEIM